jgi:hypothetical protein
VKRRLRRLVRRVRRTARREEDLFLAKRRVVAAYGAFRRAPAKAVRYLLFDRELDNFTYEIANGNTLAGFLAEALATDQATVQRYIDELEGDGALTREVESRLALRKDRNRSMPFGRRLGWYAMTRVNRPSLIVETGVHDGLGSTALLRALERNDADGHPGELVSIDLDPSVGWLIPDELRSRHHLVIGDARVEVPLAIAGRRIGLFIHDSDHRYEHETAEFEVAAEWVDPGSILLTDNAHATTAFADFCKRRGLVYRFWGEVPRAHFYPGAGIGMAVVPAQTDRVGLERSPVR